MAVVGGARPAYHSLATAVLRSDLKDPRPTPTLGRLARPGTHMSHTVKNALHFVRKNEIKISSQYFNKKSLLIFKIILFNLQIYAIQTNIIYISWWVELGGVWRGLSAALGKDADGLGHFHAADGALSRLGHQLVGAVQAEEVVAAGHEGGHHLGLAASDAAFLLLQPVH